ncbi:MAG: hypothetical protein WC371_04995, partial [Parachlamydiales bacterium]
RVGQRTAPVDFLIYFSVVLAVAVVFLWKKEPAQKAVRVKEQAAKPVPLSAALQKALCQPGKTFSIPSSEIKKTRPFFQTLDRLMAPKAKRKRKTLGDWKKAIVLTEILKRPPSF